MSSEFFFDSFGKYFSGNTVLFTIKNNNVHKIVEKKIYTPLKSMEKVDLLMKDKNLLPLKNKIQHINLMVTDQRDIVPQYDIKFGEDLEFSSFNSQGQKLIAEIDKKFALKMDTLSYTNKDEFALYYP